MTAARHLRALPAWDVVVMAPGAPDAITARLVAPAGFPAVYRAGFGGTARSCQEARVSYTGFCEPVDLPFHQRRDDRFGA